MLTLISKTDVVYPPIAQAAHVQGTVVLHAIISKSGAVEDIQVISGAPMLTSSAIDAVRHWTYKPFAPNGEPQQVDTTIALDFQYGEDGSSSVSLSDLNPIRVSGGITAGMLISKVDPVYPPEAKAARVQGAVVLKAIISKEGTIKQVEVVSGPPELTRAAIDAVHQWTYKPYLMNGEPVEVQTTITVNFSLGGSAEIPRTPSIRLDASTAKPQLWIEGVLQTTGKSSSQPDMSCTYYDGGGKGHEATCEVDGANATQYSCRANDDSKLVQAQSSCEWKVKRLEEWQRNNQKQSASAQAVAPTIREIDYSGLNQFDNEGSPLKKIGGSVSAPLVIYQVDPEMTQEARDLKFRGFVLVNLIVNAKGVPENVHILRGVGLGLDERAVEAVRQYRFRPAMENGQPVSVELNIQVNYNMVDSPQAQGPNPRPGTLSAVAPPKMRDGATAPVILRQVEPEYSEAARKAKAGGLVLVNLTVDKKGRPQHVHVVHGVGNGLDEKAIDAVRQYRFKPAMKNDKPVQEALNIEVNFQIF
jgi:TonB family protein